MNTVADDTSVVQVQAASYVTIKLAAAITGLSEKAINGKIDEGIEIYQKALSIHKNVPQVHANLGHAYLLKGDLDKAIESNQRALEVSGEFGPAHNNLAIAYLEKGDYALAIEHCDKAVALGFDVALPIRQEIEEHRAKMK